MTKTNMAVLEQACRNTRGSEWVAGMAPVLKCRPPVLLSVSSASRIRAEYHRLMRLKASKKRRRS